MSGELEIVRLCQQRHYQIEQLKHRIRKLKYLKKTLTQVTPPGGFNSERIYLDETIVQLMRRIVKISNKNKDDAIEFADRAVAYAREAATTEEDKVKINQLNRTLRAVKRDRG